jgi:antitoxin component YwqK of YwqJK toxin-antitoxin module
MKNLTKIFLIIVAAVIFVSCGKEQYSREYKVAKDGLIYKYGSNELFTGLVTDTSDLIITFEVVNGIKQGAFITFYPNGKYEKYGLIENNLNVGEWSYFFPNGQLESIGSFENNKPNGRWVSYYPDGKIKVEGAYNHGEQDGRWKYFNSKGELINIYTFQDGILLESQIKI